MRRPSSLGWLLLCCVAAVQADAVVDLPAPKSRNWGLSTLDRHSPDNEFGWSTTKPAEYRFTRDGVEVVLCYQWGCNEIAVYHWSYTKLDGITTRIARCATSAENELLAIRNAVRDIEADIYKQLPFLGNDIAGNLMDEDREGRLDCVDNSSNTNALLRVLETRRPFRYWKVFKPQRDGFAKPHLSASVITRDPAFLEKYRDRTRMGKKDYTVWVVDTWLTSFTHKPFLYEARDWKYKLDPWGNEVYRGLYEKPLACW